MLLLLQQHLDEMKSPLVLQNLQTQKRDLAPES